MKLKTQVDPYDETILTKNEINIFIRTKVIQLTKFESTVHASTVLRGAPFCFLRFTGTTLFHHVTTLCGEGVAWESDVNGA
jgi:hypothetical protein